MTAKRGPRVPRGYWTKRTPPRGFRWLRRGEIIRKEDFVNEPGRNPETGRVWGVCRTVIGGLGNRVVNKRTYLRRKPSPRRREGRKK